MTLSEKKPQETYREPQIEATVQRYLQGDSSAFDDIHRYLAPVISQVIHTKRYPGYMPHVDDIRQECWLDAVKNLPVWDPTRGTLKNFMFKCFANRIMVYLKRAESTRTFVPLEDIAEVIPSEKITTLIQDLDIELQTRFFREREQFVIRTVVVAVYVKVFHSIRAKIMKELKYFTGYSTRRLRFLVDYSLVIVRRYSLEVGCRARELLAVSFET